MPDRFWKTPREADWYEFDWSGWLEPDDPIETYSVSGVPGLVVDRVSQTEGRVRFWASGGEAGRNYVVNCLVETAQGRIAERWMTFLVR
jgi:hypothetical protein